MSWVGGFYDLKGEETEVSIFVKLFNVNPAGVPDNLQHIVTDLQSNEDQRPPSALVL